MAWTSSLCGTRFLQTSILLGNFLYHLFQQLIRLHGSSLSQGTTNAWITCLKLLNCFFQIFYFFKHATSGLQIIDYRPSLISVTSAGNCFSWLPRCCSSVPPNRNGDWFTPNKARFKSAASATGLNLLRTSIFCKRFCNARPVSKQSFRDSECSICFNKWKIWQIQTIIDGINWNDVLQETKFEILPKISIYLHIINIHILKTV